MLSEDQMTLAYLAFTQNDYLTENEIKQGKQILSKFSIQESPRTTVPFLADGSPAYQRQNSLCSLLTTAGYIATHQAYRFVFFYKRD